MRLGGLFSGIGGFELAWQRSGGTVAWMCEIDPSARKVLEARFPGVPVYPDVSKVDPDEVEPVDVLTGGSPCQGFSIAGARTGMEHIESRLFADYVRIVDGLAERGLQYAVWENVPGVLSITNDDGERTFPHVVAALVGADEPVRLNTGARWNSGLAARGRRAVAWRVIDSRHFGVPQRRRRVYACVALGRAPEDWAFRALLALPEGVQGNPAACRQQGQGTTGGAGDSAGGSFTFDRANVTSKLNRTRVGPEHPANTLAAGNDVHVAVPEVADCLTAHHGRNPGEDTFIPDVAHTLRGEGFDASEDGTGRGTPIIATSSASDVLTSEGYTQPITGRNGDPGSVLVPTLMTMREGKPGGGNGQVLFEPQTVAFAWQAGGDHTSSGAFHQDGSTPALPRSQTLATTTSYGVRRLTPVECERLQGFPDGWTEPAGSDSARYRALGNAVTVNVPQWLFGRMEVDG